MATKRPVKPLQILLQEASDPDTDPARLRELARHKEAVRRAVWRNPSVPEDVWRDALLWGKPRGVGQPDDAVLCADVDPARGRSALL
jgi:hypothetical protein